MPHSKIDVLPREVDVMQGGGDPQIDVGVRLGKAAETVHEPFCCEIRRRADGQTPALCAGSTLRAGGDAVECIAHNFEIAAPGLGDDQPLPLAIE